LGLRVCGECRERKRGGLSKVGRGEEGGRGEGRHICLIVRSA